MSSTDRQWFKKNPGRNFRIRGGAPGELEELFRRSIKAAGYDIAFQGLPPPDADHEYRVAVINAGPDLLLRMPVVRLKNSPNELSADAGGWAVMTIVLGDRIVMDRIRG